MQVPGRPTIYYDHDNNSRLTNKIQRHQTSRSTQCKGESIHKQQELEQLERKREQEQTLVHINPSWIDHFWISVPKFHAHNETYIIKYLQEESKQKEHFKCLKRFNSFFGRNNAFYLFFRNCGPCNICNTWKSTFLTVQNEGDSYILNWDAPISPSGGTVFPKNWLLTWKILSKKNDQTYSNDEHIYYNVKSKDLPSDFWDHTRIFASDIPNYRLSLVGISNSTVLIEIFAQFDHETMEELSIPVKSCRFGTRFTV